MNASTITSDPAGARQAATARAESFGQGLLLANGLVLGAVALAQSMFDLAAYFLNAGPLAGALFQNPDAIAYLEAHGLAAIMAILLLTNRNAKGPGWNLTAAAIHVLLGGANLIFWQSFVEYGLVPMGAVATSGHALFMILELLAAVFRAPVRRFR